MPAIRALSEFNRNQNALIEELRASKAPMYLTRNGAACIVVMDSEAFDDAMSFRNSVYAREMALSAKLMEAYQPVLDGNTVSADEAEAYIRSVKAWS